MPNGGLAIGATNFGGILRDARRRASLTLKELGSRIGMSASTLSKVESGSISPTYEKIVLLANGLGMDVAEFFGQAHQPMATGRRSVCRRTQGSVHRTEQYVYEMLCTDLTGKKFLPIVATLHARNMRDFPDLLRHEGEEFMYVLEGQVTLYTEYYAPLQLEVGDSCYFDSRMGHAAISSGPQEARILWVCSKNGFSPATNVSLEAASSRS